MSVKSALAIVIPDEHHNSINEIRSKYDKAYPRWMPHINLIYPFVEVFNSDELEKELKTFGQPYISIVLNDIGYFKQGSTVTYHLKSTDKDTEYNLNEIYKMVKSSCHDIKIKHDKFNPRVTLAQSDKSEIDNMMKLLKEWLQNNPIKFNINVISQLKRSDTSPFSVHKEFLIK